MHTHLSCAIHVPCNPQHFWALLDGAGNSTAHERHMERGLDMASDSTEVETLRDLRAVLERHNELQAEANILMRTLISTLEETGRTVADLTETMAEEEDED